MIDLSIPAADSAFQVADLPTLADMANQTHDRALKAANNAVQYAIDCGQILLRAKAQCKHGEWLPWLKENVRFDKSQAQRYMSLARNNAHAHNFKSIREALACLADESTPDPEPKIADLLADTPKAPPPGSPTHRPVELTREQLREEGRETQRANEERRKTDLNWLSWKAWRPLLGPVGELVNGIEQIQAQTLPPLTEDQRTELRDALRKIAAFIESFESEYEGVGG